MITPKNREYRNSPLTGAVPYIAEPLEKKLERMLENKEPIPQEESLIYTEKKQGVVPDFDIRTDRYQVLTDAMDKFYTAGNVLNTSFEMLEKDPKDQEDEKEENPNPKTEPVSVEKSDPKA